MTARCPQCNLLDRSEKLSRIVSAGTMTENAQWIGHQPRRVTTSLASQLEFQSPGGTPDVFPTATVGLCAVAGLFVLGLYFFLSPQSGYLVVSGVWFALAILAAVIGSRRQANAVEAHAHAVRQHQSRMKIWDQLYYCHRDDVLFDPDRPGSYASPADLVAYLDARV